MLEKGARMQAKIAYKPRCACSHGVKIWRLRLILEGFRICASDKKDYYGQAATREYQPSR